MNILNDAYSKYLIENERNIQFWEEYVKSLNSLDFSVFSEKLSVPALVPIGSRIFFKGQLKHTNELTVSLGADYFVKCSVKQAEVLRQHRIKDAQSKLDEFKKEKEYIENNMLFSKVNVYDNTGQEIVEVYTEEEDRAWREKHRDNVKQYKQKCKLKADEPQNEISEEELWNRLEELELQEELQNELANMNDASNESVDKEMRNSFIVKETDVLYQSEKKIHKDNDNESNNHKPDLTITDHNFEQTSKLDLLQQVINRQNDLEKKLLELKNIDRGQPKSEQDLMSRLDEMEQLDELEDEMDRLEDILTSEGVESTENDNKIVKSEATIKRGVTFSDEDDSETLEIVFKHSSVQPSNEPYAPEIGITKPSDIYCAYSTLFNETKSILKQSKYEKRESNIEINNPIMPDVEAFVSESNELDKTIVIKDIIEREDQSENKQENIDPRPISLFKKKRLLKKP